MTTITIKTNRMDTRAKTILVHLQAMKEITNSLPLLMSVDEKTMNILNQAQDALGEEHRQLCCHECYKYKKGEGPGAHDECDCT